MTNRDVASAFDFLNSMPTADVVSSVYYALRLIKHRGQFDFNNGIFLIAEGIPSEPTRKDTKIALRILDKIQQLEHSPLHALNKYAADKYVDVLSDIVLDRARKDFPNDPKRGEDLLHELRAQSTSHSYQMSPNNA